MSANFKAAALVAAVIIALSSPAPAAEQTTIFNTKDFHQDRLTTATATAELTGA